MAGFHDWDKAGFGSELLPIIPPGATLKVGTTVEPGDIGKVPGKLHGRVWSGFASWAQFTAGPADIAAWAQWQVGAGAGVGLQARLYPGVDIDVTNQGLSDDIAILADALLGYAPERVGRAPKRLLAYALAPGESLRKHRVVFLDPAGVAHAVEILGAGNQYIVDAIHPGTGQPYAWTGGVTPETMGAAGLTRITAAQVDSFLDALEGLLAGAACTGVVRTGAKGAVGSVVASPLALQGDPKVIAEALGVMGNDFTYDEWIALCAAIKAALGADEAHYQIYEDWCLQYPGNTPALAREKWDSLQPPFKTGADAIYRKAEAAGWKGRAATWGLEPVEFADTLDLSGLPDYAREWCYVSQQERFIRLSNAEVMKESQFARDMAEPGIPVDSRFNPAKLFHQLDRSVRRVANSFTYLPGTGPLLKEGDRVYANLWREPPGYAEARKRALTITDADVAPWLDHLALLIPHAVERGHFLDWSACVLQRQQEKPNWAVFLGGEQGVGKDLAVSPLYIGVGEDHTRTVQPGELASEYTSWMTNKRLVVVEEMRNFDTKTVMNKLKLYITRPPERVPVHEKFMNVYETPNVACFLFMSNFKDALSLEAGDRRFFVYWSPMKPEPQTYYDALSGWLRRGGKEEVVAWLLARDISHFNPMGRAPDTSDKQMMLEAGRSDFEKWVGDAVEGGLPPFDGALASLAGLWAALPIDAKRMPGAGLRGLAAAIRTAGGEQLTDNAGKPRLVRLDLPGEPPRFGSQRLFALRDPGAWEGADPKLLRKVFRERWAADGLEPYTGNE